MIRTKSPTWKLKRAHTDTHKINAKRSHGCHHPARKNTFKVMTVAIMSKSLLHIFWDEKKKKWAKVKAMCVCVCVSHHSLSDGDFVWMPWWHRRHALRHLQRGGLEPHYTCYKQAFKQYWLQITSNRTYLNMCPTRDLLEIGLVFVLSSQRHNEWN